MATSGRTTPTTTKPIIAPKPYGSTRPVSMVNPKPPPLSEYSEVMVTNKGRRKSEKKRNSQYTIQSSETIAPSLHSKPRKIEQQAVTENSFCLSTLIDTTKNFPITATITTGKYGQLSESSLYEERVVMHFEMRLKVIEATLEKGGTYQIPLCSANKFSLLHNPTDNTAQALMGHYYETVGHILTQPLKPKVVCATRSFNSPTPEGSVQEGDILFLSPNARTKAFKSGRFLKCCNVVTNEEKLLHENCIGGFTTQPERIKVSLRDLWEGRHINPPLKVIMYHQLPQVVLVKQIQATLLSERWEDSVIATRDHYNNPQGESLYGNTNLLRFVKELGINMVPDKEENVDPIVYKAMCEETCHLFNEFNYTRIELHLFNEDPVWPNHEEIQSSLYANITKTDWEQFVLLKKPESAFKSLKRRKSTKNYSPVLVRKPHDSSQSLPQEQSVAVSKGKTQGKTGQGDYELLKPVTKEELGDVDGQGVTIEDQPIPDFASLLHEVNTVYRQMMIQVDGLRAEVEGLKMELKQTKNMMLTIKKDVTSNLSDMRTDITNIAQNQDEHVAMDEMPKLSPESENTQILKALTSDQILQVLDKLHLVKCKPVFKQKAITGAKLIEFDAQSLEKDLNITSQLDVIRLTKLIQGCPSVWKILENPS